MPGRHSGDQVPKVKKYAAPCFLVFCRVKRYEGTIVKLYYEEGDQAATGDPLLDIEVDDSIAGPAAADEAPAAPEPPAHTPTPTPAPAPAAETVAAVAPPPAAATAVADVPAPAQAGGKIKCVPPNTKTPLRCLPHDASPHSPVLTRALPVPAPCRAVCDHARS